MDLDTTIDRVVAVKFVAENLARDGERLARFPNIVQIFSVDELDGVSFLTMDYVSRPRGVHSGV